MPTTTTPNPRPPAYESFSGGLALAKGARSEQAAELLPADLCRLIARLHAELEPERQQLLAARAERQRRWDAGEVPGYVSEGELPEAQGDWRIDPLPADLLERRVEITGPINDPKMVINMLSRDASGVRADAAMLDFEDSMKPSWPNVLAGLENYRGAARGDLSFTRPAGAGEPERIYRLDPDDRPLVMVRVRGLHLDETNVATGGEAIAAGILDYAASAWHGARELLAQGRTPKFYVPKCEHYLEARWWDRLFTLVEEALGVATGTFKTTFLIETLPAAFQVEEILWETRRHASGMNVGRWDKIFSDIKCLIAHPDRVLADRATIGLDRPWMKAYALRLIQVCHRHGAFGMGGMAAFTPGRTAERRAEQTAKVKADKELEFSMGHDGCWVSHPYFIGPALAAFPEQNQLGVMPDLADRPDLLPVACGPQTLDGLHKNVRVGIAYVRGWNADIGCVAWDDLMEDLATLEISRAQTAQWLRHSVEIEDTGPANSALVRRVFEEEYGRIEDELRHARADDATVASYRDAARDAEAIFTEESFRPFLAKSSDSADLTVKERRARLRGGYD
ncbi:MAG TPA: malate synthase A [Thermoanaerobaculia bacterium]|nr:malate synthase A [Thermoanaerobaculia bacterium]